MVVKDPIRVNKDNTEVTGSHAGKRAHEGIGAHRGKRGPQW